MERVTEFARHEGCQKGERKCPYLVLDASMTWWSDSGVKHEYMVCGFDLASQGEDSDPERSQQCSKWRFENLAKGD
jgi:hypothetical protein